VGVGKLACPKATAPISSLNATAKRTKSSPWLRLISIGAIAAPHRSEAIALSQRSSSEFKGVCVTRKSASSMPHGYHVKKKGKHDYFAVPDKVSDLVFPFFSHGII
jgi:hypothetical protein